MKRGADKQLSKDDDQDDVAEVCAHSYRVRCATMSQYCQQEISTGFQMAKDSDLAKRQCVSSLLSLYPLDLTNWHRRIRGLPKRRSPAVAPVPPPATSGTTVCPTLPYSPLHSHQHPITSNQLLHKGSVGFQDSDQPAAQHPLSPSRHHLPLLAQP